LSLTNIKYYMYVALYAVSHLFADDATVARMEDIEGPTVMRIIKLTLFPIPVRLHSGSGKLKYRLYITIFCDI